MVSRLKGEKEVYQAQVKRLLKFLKQAKREGTHQGPIDVLQHKAMLELGHKPEDQLQTPLYSPEPIITEDCHQFYHTLYPGPRGSRASTLTTYISTTPDDLSPADTFERAGHRSPNSIKSPNQAPMSRAKDPLLIFDHVTSPTSHIEDTPDYKQMNKNRVEMITLGSPNGVLPSSLIPPVIPNIHPSRELRPRTLNLLDKTHVIPEYEEETSYITPPMCGVKHSQSCDAILQRKSAHEKLNFIIYI